MKNGKLLLLLLSLLVVNEASLQAKEPAPTRGEALLAAKNECHLAIRTKVVFKNGARESQVPSRGNRCLALAEEKKILADAYGSSFEGRVEVDAKEADESYREAMEFYQSCFIHAYSSNWKHGCSNGKIKGAYNDQDLEIFKPNQQLPPLD